MSVKALERRLSRLEGDRGTKWVCVSVPEDWNYERGHHAGRALAEAAGYRGNVLVFPFGHTGDAEPRLIGEGFLVLIGLLDQVEKETQQ